MPSYAKVERWQDRQAGSTKTGTLQQAMTLDPTYFPEELYSAKDKRWDGSIVCHLPSACFETCDTAAGSESKLFCGNLSNVQQITLSPVDPAVNPLQDISKGGITAGAACVLGGLCARQHRRC